MTDDKLLILRALSTLRQVRDAKLPELALLPSFHELIDDLGARLAQPEPEPVGWLYGTGDYAEFRRTKDGSGSAIRTPLYTAPPQREWQGLTEKEQADIAIECGARSVDWLDFATAIESKLKKKNG